MYADITTLSFCFRKKKKNKAKYAPKPETPQAFPVYGQVIYSPYMRTETWQCLDNLSSSLLILHDNFSRAVHKFPSTSVIPQEFCSAFTYSMHFLYLSTTFLLPLLPPVLLPSCTPRPSLLALVSLWLLHDTAPGAACSSLLCARWAPAPLLQSWCHTDTLPSLLLPSSVCSSCKHLLALWALLPALCKCLLAVHKLRVLSVNESWSNSNDAEKR